MHQLTSNCPGVGLFAWARCNFDVDHWPMNHLEYLKAQKKIGQSYYLLYFDKFIRN